MASVTVRVRALKEKRTDISTPNLVHIYSMPGPRHALTLESRCQTSRSQVYEVCFQQHGSALHVDMTA